MRLRVAANIALHTAAATGGNPGSPNPVGESWVSTNLTSISGGESIMRMNL